MVLTKKKYTPVTDEDIIGAWWYDEVGTEYAAHEVELREDGVVDYFPHKVVWGIVNERMITRSQETGLIDSIAYGDTLSSDLF